MRGRRPGASTERPSWRNRLRTFDRAVILRFTRQSIVDPPPPYQVPPHPAPPRPPAAPFLQAFGCVIAFRMTAGTLRSAGSFEEPELSRFWFRSSQTLRHPPTVKLLRLCGAVHECALTPRTRHTCHLRANTQLLTSCCQEPPCPVCVCVCVVSTAPRYLLWPRS